MKHGRAIARRALWLLAGASACYSGPGGSAGLEPGATGGGGPGATDDGGDDRGSGDEGVGAQCGADEPSVGVTGLRLLTRYEYDNTVRDLLGEESNPSGSFPPENQTTAFENSAQDHRASKDLVRVYMDTAEDVAVRTVSERMATLLPCDPLVAGEAECGRALVEHLLPRAFRRPVPAAERAPFQALWDDAHVQYGFVEAASLLLQAVLQSPQFLYRIEHVPPDASPGDVVPVTGYQMASRLSYFLIASMPDDALMAAAAEDRLSTPEQIEAQAWRLLDSEDGHRTVRQFHRQWLGLTALASVGKDPAQFPALPPLTAGEDWRKSVERFAEHVFYEGDASLEQLLSSSVAFLPESLVGQYGTSPDPRPGAVQLAGDRAGLLTQPGLMALLANPGQSSPVARGVFVRERLLCQHLPPPPNDMAIEPPDPDPNATTRERFDQHTADPECAGCHQLIDPLGFGFEHYDAIGRWRTEENGAPVDASGFLDSIRDDAQIGAYDGALELASRLLAASDFRECVAHQWTTFALGREPGPDDACAMEQIHQSLEDGSLRDMLVAIAVSDAFRFRVVDGGAR